MEYELSGAQTLVLKKIFLLFRHVSANLQIVASENGLNLYALNGSNSAWLHIQLGRGFFKRIDCSDIDATTIGGSIKAKHWVVSTKHLCQSLSIVVPPSQKNNLYSAVFMKDIGNCDDIRTTVALEKLILREDKQHPNLLSFILHCASQNIRRSATISFEEYKLSIPDELRWHNWHYLRIQPTVLYKSINPYSSQSDDLSISYDDTNEDIILNIIKNSTQSSGRSKSKKNKKSGFSGQISINSGYFQKLELDDNISHPEKITISLKEFLSLISFCESMKSPLSLILKCAGEPVIALFGGAVNISESVTDYLNIHHIVASGTSQTDGNINDTILTQHNFSWSGSLWISSVQNEEPVQCDVEETEKVKVDTPVNELDLFEDEIEDYIECEVKNTNNEKAVSDKLPASERIHIYNTLSLDFIPDQDILTQLFDDSPNPVEVSSKTGSFLNTINNSDDEKDEDCCDELADIW